MWPRSDLQDLLGIIHPIIQAPMANAANASLTAAVSNAGGLGSLGCSSMTMEALKQTLAATRDATNRPFNANFFASPAVAPPADDAAAMREHLAPYYDELDIDAPRKLRPAEAPFDAEIMETVLKFSPGIMSFHYGLPEPGLVEEIKRHGTVILSSATTVAEAKQLEEAGVDAVIAQGYEAGGHRATFEEPFEVGEVGAFALIPQIADAVGVPVIAAGGIADGRAIAAALALGASGVQMGTAFLSCPEAPVSPLYKARLAEARDTETQVTRALTGRPARALINRLVSELAPHQRDAAEFPLQRQLTAKLATKAEADGSTDFSQMWAGQAAALSRAMPAAELVETLVSETETALASLSG